MRSSQDRLFDISSFVISQEKDHKKEHGLRAVHTSTYASALAYVCTQSTGVTVDADTHGSVKIRAIRVPRYDGGAVSYASQR